MSIYKCMTCDTRTIHGWVGWTCDDCDQKKIPEDKKENDIPLTLTMLKSENYAYLAIINKCRAAIEDNESSITSLTQKMEEVRTK